MPLRLVLGLPPSPHRDFECGWGDEEQTGRWLCDCASKGVARERWQAGTWCAKLKCLAMLTFLPDSTCLCSPVYTLCSNIKCNSGSFMAYDFYCELHFWHRRSTRGSRGMTVSLGYGLLTCQCMEVLCERSSSSTKTAVSAQGNWNTNPALGVCHQSQLMFL